MQAPSAEGSMKTSSSMERFVDENSICVKELKE